MKPFSYFSLSATRLLVSTVLIFVIARRANGQDTSIFSFGDSITDTGNLYASSLDTGNFHHSFFPPYGETFFHHPTGRCSDGRLVIDFLAESFGLPYLPPYLAIRNKGPENFKWGVNFAVTGATALDESFFSERGIAVTTNDSLGIQLDWFKELLPSLCLNSADCRGYFKSSLFVMGEIGGNDYNYPLLDSTYTEDVQTIVPFVINNISSAIKDLIRLGATTFLVPGNFPIGCIPMYLTVYMSLNVEDYDPDTGCINWLNKFSEFHNEQLRNEINRIQEEYSHVKIIYADYYSSTTRFYRAPEKFGFGKNVLRACCGGGGPYNYNFSAKCGYSSASACDDPSLSVSWDGIHLTEAAYKWIAKSLLEGPIDLEELSAAI